MFSISSLFSSISSSKKETDLSPLEWKEIIQLEIDKHIKYEIIEEIEELDYHLLQLDSWKPIWWTIHKETKALKIIRGKRRYFHYTLSPFYQKIAQYLDTSRIANIMQDIFEETSKMNTSCIYNGKMYDMEYKADEIAKIRNVRLLEFQMEALILINRYHHILIDFEGWPDFTEEHIKYKYLFSIPLLNIPSFEDVPKLLDMIKIDHYRLIMECLTDIKIYLIGKQVKDKLAHRILSYP
jgi:hypothetical protein